MESHSLPDQFFKSWTFAFVVCVAFVGALQAFDLLPIDKVLTRQAPVWGALVVALSLDPVLRFFGLLDSEIEHRWADFTIATLLGRSVGALSGATFAWMIAIVGS
jgi:hypothetical protein